MRKSVILLLLITLLLGGCALHYPVVNHERLILQFPITTTELYCGESIEIKWANSSGVDRIDLTLYDVENDINYWPAGNLIDATKRIFQFTINVPGGRYRIVIQDSQHRLRDRSQIVEIKGCF
ncbi:MAG: hypothetical protein A2655_02600 [Candidatus Yanofskybacteria bacterium RIFCSPHIGHO2_01_FULL_43_42]|uniref:Uncharacterized protein n=1 Tax=Candidatus Yanofskybacteria bacterium RIFCSPLOWO2_01_FULL_43_22 TaxID=1802695 RepID=A0A1F8GGK6_9BACT|nr:MAG: hypothetical protein A2655_02600 [Candidatus Yanofskybacteria bacterium RIFCSPHIGHO2_01_FULL_43_42]OGN12440.1 MAG: hypothetical protein A3D48_00520 [Candidatus Yanofskybacteria bacterium RIFCSPHIGHO2_02_FULL_43_17]OGN24433.1 MAG: hypothetical protein A3A13_03430 [Candidatus Yanofskybacteria bacterium RIFCSPLOWO2_01_FULL_43_22]